MGKKNRKAVKAVMAAVIASRLANRDNGAFDMLAVDRALAMADRILKNC